MGQIMAVRSIKLALEALGEIDLDEVPLEYANYLEVIIAELEDLAEALVNER
jgi:hypothetical protein